MNPLGFFACGHGPCTATAVPTWHYESSIKDVRKTNYVDDAYCDYVLHSRPERQCMQYIKIGSEMVDDIRRTQLPDHLPVHADFNLVAPYCTPDVTSPRGPREVKLDKTTPSYTFSSQDDAAIAHPGNMKWYGIGDKGTYWIQSYNGTANVAFEVYEEDDLSTPIGPYHGETDPEKGKRFVATKPLFVRVFAVHPDGTPDRTAVGS